MRGDLFAISVKFQGRPLLAGPGFVNLLQGQSAIDQRDVVVAVQGVGVRAGNNRIRSSRTGLGCRGAVAGSDVVPVLDSRDGSGEWWERLARSAGRVIGLDGQWRGGDGQRRSIGCDSVVAYLVGRVVEPCHDGISSYGAGRSRSRGRSQGDVVTVAQSIDRAREGRIWIAVHARCIGYGHRQRLWGHSQGARSGDGVVTELCTWIIEGRKDRVISYRAGQVSRAGESRADLVIVLQAADGSTQTGVSVPIDAGGAGGSRSQWSRRYRNVPLVDVTE